MKTMKNIIFLLLILITSLLIFSCNSEDRGVFLRISESVVRENVGLVTIIMKDGGNLIAHTELEGIKTYNPTSKKWEQLIDQSSDLDVIDPKSKSINKDHVSTHGTDLYFATTAYGEDNNYLFEYTSTTTLPFVAAHYKDSYKIARMAPNADLMVIKKGDGTYSVVSTSDAFNNPTTYTEKLNNLDYDEMNLLALDNNTYVISGYTITDDTRNYHHVLDGAAASDNDTIASVIVAMHFDSSNSKYVFITNSGKIYYGANINSPSEGSTVPLPETNMSLRNLPVLTDGTHMYIQGANRSMYQIDSSDGSYDDVTDDFPSDLANVDISSFYSDGTNNYVGTKDNGIIEFDFPTP